MHLVTVDEVDVVPSAAEVEVCGTQGQFIAAVGAGFLTLLHEANEGNESRAWTNHKDGNVMRVWHHEV